MYRNAFHGKNVYGGCTFSANHAMRSSACGFKKRDSYGNSMVDFSQKNERGAKMKKTVFRHYGFIEGTYSPCNSNNNMYVW